MINIIHIADRFSVVSLPSNSGDWCNAGASTSLGHYSSWLERTIEYLDASFTETVTDELDVKIKTKDQKKNVLVVDDEGVSQEDADEDNSCSADPCGDHAQCWNGDGSSYLCTCKPDYPHGNPYIGCAKCQYDNQCGPGQECRDQECVEIGEQGANGAADGYHVPPEYVQVAGEQYFISDKPMSWTHAQTSCMSREGNFFHILIKNEYKIYIPCAKLGSCRCLKIKSIKYILRPWYPSTLQ